jgi:mutual gliding-motility protein MglA
MVELNHRQRTIKVKIVYYGPPVGGKTTNLQVLHQNVAPERRGEMVSINSAQDRTILFDLLPMKAAGFRGFDLKLQLLAVPGQAMYAATRRLVLKGADSVVFVANSAADRWEENVQSFREMTDNLLAHQLDPAALPLVLQYNKRDLPEVTPVDFMDRTLNARKVHALPAVAVRGEGVLETFASVLAATMEDLSVRYQIVDVARGQPLQQWTKQTLLTLFGVTSLAPPASDTAPAPPAPPREPPRDQPPPERRTVRIALPEEAVRLASSGPNARANETLVDSYAEAATRLSADMADLREEKDLLRRRLAEMRVALGASQDVLGGQPLDATLRMVLGPMSDALGADQASFLVPLGGRAFRAAALRGLRDDPLLRLHGGPRSVLERFLVDTEPRIHASADALDLAEALNETDPPFTALAAVPVRTPRALQALALMYYPADSVLPRADALAHVGSMATALAAALELGTALEATRTAERVQGLAMTGLAAQRGVEDILAAILVLRDRLGAIRRRPELPTKLFDDFGRLAPSLTDALCLARSLLGFGRGEVAREMVDLDDILADVRTRNGISLHLQGDVTVAGDVALLRLAVATLIEHAQALGPDSLELRTRLDGGRVKIQVRAATESAGHSSALSPEEAGLGQLRLAFVQRIAELHGGLVGQESGEDGRAWTTLILPPA